MTVSLPSVPEKIMERVIREQNRAGEGSDEEQLKELGELSLENSRLRGEFSPSPTTP